ncbi:DUF3948 family protein [Bacillus mycoides]|nr:DUF3948 family protein [Bacillus mycoides]
MEQVLQVTKMDLLGAAVLTALIVFLANVLV